ncbi:MAG: hypothetical protein AAB225_20610 [Acidobacteriota bacterium]
MRLAGRCLLLALGFVLVAPASEAGPAHLTLWKLANFALFAGAIGYVLWKKAGGFFRSRTEQIRREIAEAARFHREAEARCAAIEQRLAGLDAEIESWRAKARQEAAHEQERARQAFERDLKRIQAGAEQEIAAAANDARQQLRAHAAELAVRLAAGKIRQRLTPEVEDRIVLSVAGDLERQAGRR